MAHKKKKGKGVLKHNLTLEQKAYMKRSYHEMYDNKKIVKV